MAIKGSLKEASLPDVLQLLSLGQKTGCLSLTDRTNLGYVYFDQGRITYAAIVNRRDRLGDILLNSGKVNKEQLDDAVAQQDSDRDKKLGEILVELDAISSEELQRYMRVQVEEAIYHLFTWTRGSFHFEVDIRPERQDFLLSINPETLLLEGARRIDEWSLIEKKITSFDLVFTLDRSRLDNSDVELTEPQRIIIPLIDGDRSVATVVERAGLSEFDVGKALYGLITAGFVHRSRVSETATKTVATDAKIEEHRNLGVAFYRTGMLDEAAREFRRVVDLDPKAAEAHFHLGLVSLQRQEWHEALEVFQRVLTLGGDSPAVKYNVAFCLEQLGKFDEAETTYGEAASNGGTDHRFLTGWGAIALRQRKFEVAETRLQSAKETAGERRLSEIWYWAMCLSHAARNDLVTAEGYANEGLKLYPRSAVLRNNFAVILELRGELEQAENELRAAISEGLVLPQLSKNLGDILYRHGRFEDAWESYERAVEIDPELGDDVYFKLGNIAYKNRDQDRAAYMWEQALRRNPQHQLARTNLETMNALRG